MRVSIVTISYNQARYLPRAIASILSQDHSDLEYILVDPGSRDGSRDVIAEASSRLAQVVFEPDQGPADGLNHGFARATGHIYGYVNADDALLPGAVSEAVAYFETHPHVDVVYGDGYLVDADGWVIRPIDSSPFDLTRYSYGHVTVLQPATFFREHWFRDVGGFNASNPVSWDGEFVVDVALLGGVLRHVRRRWAAWAMYSETISGGAGYDRKWSTEQARLFQRIRGRPIGRGDLLSSAAHRVERWLVSPGTVAERARGIVTAPPSLRLVHDGGHVAVVSRRRPDAS